MPEIRYDYLGINALFQSSSFINASEYLSCAQKNFKISKKHKKETVQKQSLFYRYHNQLNSDSPSLPGKYDILNYELEVILCSN